MREAYMSGMEIARDHWVLLKLFVIVEEIIELSVVSLELSVVRKLRAWCGKRA